MYLAWIDDGACSVIFLIIPRFEIIDTLVFALSTMFIFPASYMNLFALAFLGRFNDNWAERLRGQGR
jgi:hypothetical protein